VHQRLRRWELLLAVALRLTFAWCVAGVLCLQQVQRDGASLGGRHTLVQKKWSSSNTAHAHAGDVEHYQYQYDQDWGCGCDTVFVAGFPAQAQHAARAKQDPDLWMHAHRWRNIQMTCSHLVKNQARSRYKTCTLGKVGGWARRMRLRQLRNAARVRRQDYAGKLFGGVDFVPDIPSLQAWLECAWRQGFDPDGASQLGGHVQVSLWFTHQGASTAHEGTFFYE